MERTTIAAIFADQEALGGQTVTVCGWARTIRDMKTFGFIELNDGSCFKNLQVVMDANVLDNYKEIAGQNVGAALIVTGTVVLTPEAKQPLEVKAASIAVEGPSTPDYPLQKKRHSVEFLRTIQHLRPRTNLFSAAFRVRSVAAHAVHCFFQDRGFVYVNTPIITASDCEGAGEMFQVTTLDLENVPKNPDGTVDYAQDFFGKRASLTVSGQLNAENFAMAFGNVYTFGPTFRAEKSNTQRHAAEFWMIEPEMAFADLGDYMDNAEAMIKYVIRYVMDKCPNEMNFFNSFVDKGLKERLEHVASSDFARVTYTEAVKILEENNDKFDFKVYWGCDLQTEHERYLTEQVYKRPVFVTDYPKEIKAFYMRQNDDGKTVAAADCLVPGIGELIGGSQREERLEVLEARIKELGMDPEDYWWYCDLRKYGTCRHAGYGMGFERMVMYLTGVNNIRDVELHPRTWGNADFSENDKRAPIRTPPPAAPRRGPIADGAARMRRPSVLSEGQNLAADGIYFRPRFFNRVPTGAERVCGRNCTPERWGTRISNEHYWAPVWLWFSAAPRRGPAVVRSIQKDGPPLVSQLNRARRLPENPAAVFL